MSTHIDIHVIQTVPPSNVNRDDTGAPKSALYGGVRRARVSSQAWKRATRAHFQVDLDPAGLGYRTKQAASLIGERIHTLRPEMPEEERAARAGSVLKALGLKLEPKRRRKTEDETGSTPYESSAYLTFFSSSQLDQLAELAVSSDKPTKKEAQERADTNHGIAISLFGRMVADDATLKVDASVQVAHALSTHAVDTEADYYTAVDDVSEQTEESGAGMIGTIEFNSSTLYRYATLNVDALAKNLGNRQAAARAAETFVRSFIVSMPTGKRNTFANGTLPDAVVVAVRGELPVNLVGAFEVPVAAGQGGFVQRSCEALATYATEVAEAYGSAPLHTFVLRVGERASAVDAMGERATLDGLGERVREVVNVSGESEPA